MLQSLAREQFNAVTFVIDLFECDYWGQCGQLLGAHYILHFFILSYEKFSCNFFNADQIDLIKY